MSDYKIMVKQKIKIVVLSVFVVGGAFVFTRTGQTQTSQPKADQVKTAGEVYKNVQVLKDIPADQWDKVMAIFSGSLGVKCNFCHIPGQWEKDDKEEKKTAREMIKMTLAINKDNFGGRTEISCNTCHNGRSQPSSAPTLGVSLWLPADPAQQQQQQQQPAKETLPTVDQILDKYQQALGGKEAIEKVTTRIERGQRIGADGVAVPEEVYQKSTGKISVTTTYPQQTFTTVSDGTKVWAINGKGESHSVEGDEAEQFKRDVQLMQPGKLKEVYKEMSVAGVDKIGDKEVYLVRAVTQAGRRERLYFDKQTGLLVRRFASSPTAIGTYPFQVDYSDYKAFDGVQIPMTIQWAIPGRVWSRKITEVKQNAAIDDAKFNPPTK